MTPRKQIGRPAAEATPSPSQARARKQAAPGKASTPAVKAAKAASPVRRKPRRTAGDQGPPAAIADNSPRSTARAAKAQAADPDARIRVAAAPHAAPDLESELAELHAVARTQRELKADYEARRDRITPRLHQPMVFLATDGTKMIATRQESSDTVIDVAQLKREVEPEVFRKVTRTEVDRDAFKAACTRGDIPPEVLVAVVRIKPKAASVRFSDKLDDAMDAAYDE